MIGTIRKHSKWLWAVIITITIITFVFWNSSSNSSGDRKVNLGTIDGVPVTQEAYVDALREAWLEHFLNYGANPRYNFDEQRMTYVRLFWLKKLKDYNIQVHADAPAEAAHELLRSNNITIDRFAEMIRPNATLSDLERYLKHTLAIQQLQSVVGVSSELVTPDEVRALYVRDFQELATEAVFFSATNYASSVTNPSPDVLTRFYERHMANYRLPERLQVQYIKFDSTNFMTEANAELAKITNLTERLDEAYQKRGSNAFPNKTAEEAKKQMVADELQAIAREAARKKAERVAEELYNLGPAKSGNLALIARTNGMELKTTAPFDETAGPPELETGMTFGRAAFALTPEEPQTEQPVYDSGAFFLLALDKRIPSEIPPLDKIRDQVLADFKHDQALLIARRAGTEFAQSATNGIAHGKSFAAICTEAKVKLVSVPPISFSTRALPEVEDHISLFEYKRVAFSATVGKVTPVFETQDGVGVVFVREQLPIDQAKMNSILPDFTRTVRMARRQEAINSWTQREAMKSMRDTPLAPRPAAPGSAPRT